MKNQSKRKFTYLGQTYNLPEYFDCSLEIYAIESDPDIFRWYSKPTIRKSLDITEQWCGTSKAEVMSPIHWDLVADHTDALKIIAENSRMGKYGGPSGSNESIFVGKCPVRFRSGTAIFRIFFDHFKDQTSLISFKNQDCATLNKIFFYSNGDGEASFKGDIFLSQSLEDIYADLKDIENWLNHLPLHPGEIYSPEKIFAKSLIKKILQTSTSPKELFLTLDRSNFLQQSDTFSRPKTMLAKNSFEAFEVPPACHCEFGTVNYLSLWYQIKQQLFDIINE